MTPAPTAKPASLSQLEKIVLQPADVPPGWNWKGTAAPAAPGDTSAVNVIMACVGSPGTKSDEVADVYSPVFGLGNAGLASEAISYRSQSDVDSDVAALHSPKASSCYGQFWKEALSSSHPAVTAELTPGPAGGPASVVSTGTATVKEQQVTLYVTVAFMTGPLIEAEVDTFNVGTPEPASLVSRLVAAVAARSAKG